MPTCSAFTFEFVYGLYPPSEFGALGYGRFSRADRVIVFRADATDSSTDATPDAVGGAAGVAEPRQLQTSLKREFHKKTSCAAQDAWVRTY